MSLCYVPYHVCWKITDNVLQIIHIFHSVSWYQQQSAFAFTSHYLYIQISASIVYNFTLSKYKYPYHHLRPKSSFYHFGHRSSKCSKCISFIHIITMAWLLFIRGKCFNMNALYSKFLMPQALCSTNGNMKSYSIHFTYCSKPRKFIFASYLEHITSSLFVCTFTFKIILW